MQETRRLDQRVSKEERKEVSTVPGNNCFARRIRWSKMVHKDKEEQTKVVRDNIASELRSN